MVDAFDRGNLLVIGKDGSRWHATVDQSSKLFLFRGMAAHHHVEVDCVVVVRFDNPKSNKSICSKFAAHLGPHCSNVICSKNLVNLDRDGPCVGMVHVDHVAEDDPCQLVGFIEIPLDRGCESFVLETTWDGVPGVDLK